MYHSGVSATLPRPQFSTKGSAAISCCPEGRVHFGAPPRVSPPGFRALGPLRRVSSKVFTQRTPWYRTYRIVRFVSVRRYSFFSHLAPFLGLNETRATNILQANWSLPLCVITCHNHVHVVGIHVSGIAIFFSTIACFLSLSYPSNQNTHFDTLNCYLRRYPLRRLLQRRWIFVFLLAQCHGEWSHGNSKQITMITGQAMAPCIQCQWI